MKLDSVKLKKAIKKLKVKPGSDNMVACIDTSVNLGLQTAINIIEAHEQIEKARG